MLREKFLDCPNMKIYTGHGNDGIFGDSIDKRMSTECGRKCLGCFSACIISCIKGKQQ